MNPLVNFLACFAFLFTATTKHSHTFRVFWASFWDFVISTRNTISRDAFISKFSIFYLSIFCLGTVLKNGISHCHKLLNWMNSVMDRVKFHHSRSLGIFCDTSCYWGAAARIIACFGPYFSMGRWAKAVKFKLIWGTAFLFFFRNFKWKWICRIKISLRQVSDLISLCSEIFLHSDGFYACFYICFYFQLRFR